MESNADERAHCSKSFRKSEDLELWAHDPDLLFALLDQAVNKKLRIYRRTDVAVH